MHGFVSYVIVCPWPSTTMSVGELRAALPVAHVSVMSAVRSIFVSAGLVHAVRNVVSLPTLVAPAGVAVMTKAPPRLSAAAQTSKDRRSGAAIRLFTQTPSGRRPSAVRRGDASRFCLPTFEARRASVRPQYRVQVNPSRRLLTVPSVVLVSCLAVAACAPQAPPPPPLATPSRAPASSAPGTTASPSPSSPAIPVRVAVIVMENHGYSSVVGLPYIRTIASTATALSDYHASGHPSLPNYLALTSGTTWGITDDGYHALPAQDIGHQLTAAAVPWGAYMEGMGSDCRQGNGEYAVKHDPFAYYGGQCQPSVAPFSQLGADLASATPPRFIWITPNLCNDMHDCAPSVGDAWLQRTVPILLASPAMSNGIVVITWDENEGGSSNQVLTWYSAASARPALAPRTLTRRCWPRSRTCSGCRGCPPPRASRPSLCIERSHCAEGVVRSRVAVTDTTAPGPEPAVAVVTGAGRGIGAAVARRLASSHTVLAVARTESELAETAAGLPAIRAHRADVGVAGAMAEVASAAEELGRLAVWVNNAATLDPSPFMEITDERWRAVMAVNLDGAFAGCREAMRLMARHGGGVIVNMASLSGVAGVEKFPGNTSYNVSKAGLIGLTEAVALEGRPVGVRCVALSPGAVDTAMLRRAAPHLHAGMTPDDVAALVEFLISDAAAPLSGTNIPIYSNR